jgi:FolB domain-containing protein
MDKILIEKMVVHGIVGAKPRERVKPQALHVSLTLWTDFAQAAASDDLQHAIDYRLFSYFPVTT